MSIHRGPTASRATAAANLAVLAFLAVVTCLVGGRDWSADGLSWSDAPLHVMDGVFLRDLLVERPGGSWRAWAEAYYLRYQSLGLIVYYPPLFAAIEAVVFLLLGVSIAAARLMVLTFAVGAVWLIYLLGRDRFGGRAGLAAAVLSIASPAGLAWSQDVMLEWPSVFFIVLALWAVERYLRQPRWRGGVLVAAACAAAYLTKQTAAFVLLLIAVHAWGDRRGRSLMHRSFLIPMALAALAIAGYGLATRSVNRLAPQLILGSPPLQHLLEPATWTWYLARLPHIIGWPVLIATLMAVAVLLGMHLSERARVRSGEEPRASVRAAHPLIPLMLPAAWLFIWWVICSVFAAKEERYFFFAVPAIAMIAAAGLARLDGQRRMGFGSAALAVLCTAQLIAALRTPTMRLPSMRPTVEVLAARRDADLVLVDALRDGQFIFDVRTTPAARDRLIAMRASKFLYSRAARTQYDYQAHVSTQDELLAWLDRYGIRYVVVEDRPPHTPDLSWDPPPRALLRATLRDQRRFEPVYRQSMATADPAWRDVQLVTYQYLEAKVRRSDTITLHIPAMGRDVTLPLPSTRPAP